MDQILIEKMDRFLNEYEKLKRIIKIVAISSSIELVFVFWSILRPSEKLTLITAGDFLIVGLILTLTYLFLMINKLKLLRDQIWVLSSKMDLTENKNIVINNNLIEEVYH